jgi:23S rRNA pseudouridine1911/1915/1917 synthase
MTPEKLDFIIPENIETMRIDKAIALETHLSRSLIAQIFKQDKVTLNSKIAKRSEKVNSGDKISLEFIPIVEQQIQGEDIDFEVVFEDDFLLVINKVPNMIVHPGAGNLTGTLANALIFRYPDIINVGQAHRPGIVHRLDSGTSGLLVVAKTQECYEKFVELFSTHEVDRRYIALIWGKLNTKSGIIDAPIGRSLSRATKMAVRDDGKFARTHYNENSHFAESNTTLMDISLETGRTHQIRVHFAAIGHPIVGDKTYGGYRQNVECPRTFLHAQNLNFIHPITDKAMTFSAKLPKDLSLVLEELKNKD